MYLASGDGLALVRSTNGRLRADLELVGFPTQCVAVDPARPEIGYCGTFGRGLYRTENAGRSWTPVGSGIGSAEVTAVAVSALERNGESGVVWAGTEPSAPYRSEDGGNQWIERRTLRDLPSAPTWSFPPRPWTSHVRWIAPDPTEARRLFVGIELGGVMRSLDAGETWEDRKPGSQHDAHTLRTHTAAPGHVYEAAGGGFAESHDGGATWQGFDSGLTRTYVWGLAVDPGDPGTAVVSASPGPRQAHGEPGEAGIYRRAGDGVWIEVRAGLPPQQGTRAYVLAANPAEPGVFYAATRDGDVYRSPDAGLSWERFDLSWPDGYRAPDVRGFVVFEA